MTGGKQKCSISGSTWTGTGNPSRGGSVTGRDVRGYGVVEEWSTGVLEEWGDSIVEVYNLEGSDAVAFSVPGLKGEIPVQFAPVSVWECDSGSA